MGCDIHGVIERQWEGKWIAFRTLDHIHTSREKGVIDAFKSPAAMDRNYRRFAALAGVRGDGPEAKGMPEDASDTSKMLFELEGDHTPSWIPLIDACRIFVETEFHAPDDYFKKYPEYYYFGVEPEIDGELQNFRFVFWFDS